MATEQEILARISQTDREKYFLTQAGQMANTFLGNGQPTAPAIDTMAGSLVSYGDPSADSSTRQAAMQRYSRAQSNLGPKLSEEVKDLYKDIIG